LLGWQADEARDFLDIGANIGYYSLYLAPCVRRVYAFEPDERCLATLRANARIARNVEVVAQAVTARSGLVRFDVSDGTEFSHIAEGGEREVMATSVDDFVATTEADVGLIKIDVEGHDLSVLLGARKTLRATHALVLTEFSQPDDGHNSTDALHEICAALDYEIYGHAYARDGNPAHATLCRMDAIDERGISKMLFLVPPRLHARFAREASLEDRARVGEP
jgi:FkbM family methyltransferase